MTTVNDVEQYLNSLTVDYKITEDDIYIQVKLPEYKQSILININNDFEYTKGTIDSVFKDRDLDTNQQCISCLADCAVWQLCHACYKEVCMECFINQRVLNNGANICSLCNHVNDANIMTSDELANWLAVTYVEVGKLLAINNE